MKNWKLQVQLEKIKKCLEKGDHLPFSLSLLFLQKKKKRKCDQYPSCMMFMCTKVKEIRFLRRYSMS